MIKGVPIWAWMVSALAMLVFYFAVGTVLMSIPEPIRRFCHKWTTVIGMTFGFVLMQCIFWMIPIGTVVLLARCVFPPTP